MRRVVTMHPIGLDLCGPCTSEVDAVPTSTPRERAIVAAWAHLNNEVGYFRGDLADAADPEVFVSVDGSISLAALADAMLAAAYPEPTVIECDACGSQLGVVVPATITHNADGTHTYDPGASA
jgi:hypothetical protein